MNLIFVRENVRAGSIECVLVCQKWPSKLPRNLMSPFSACIVKKSQEKEIASLKSTVFELQSQLEELKSANGGTDLPTVTQIPTQPSYSSAVQSNPSTETVSRPHPSKRDTFNAERKYNIVIYGLKECQKGSSRHERITQDTERVGAIIQSVASEISEQSLRDCIRLGKYSDTKCRPVLAKLLRSCDVSSILANRRKLCSNPNVSIKPDMTHEERAIKSTLLRERRQLINEGIERSNINIRGNVLFVNKKKYGSVVNAEFSLYNPISTEGGTGAEDDQTSMSDFEHQ